MGSAIINIVVGIVFIVAAAMGSTLMFTDSIVALYGVGGAIVALGVYQAVRARGG